MASLESGAITCATAIAVTRSRCRDGTGSMSSSKPQLAGRAQDGGDVAVRQGADDLERPVLAGGLRLALQHPGQRLDLVAGQADRLASVRFRTLSASR